MDSKQNVIKELHCKPGMTKQLNSMAWFWFLLHMASLGCCTKGVCALRGYFAPLRGQKIKVALRKFLCISLLEQ